jgi:tRNA pseudouridine38-40 synthase
VNRTLKAVIAYDGTDFVGWQVQARGRTVQAVVEAGLARMQGGGGRVRVTAAGRTDSGVHAIGQVINFDTPLGIPVERYAEAVNSYLPADVRLMEVGEVDPSFDARRCAVQRTYRYYVACGQVLPPHLRRYCIWLRRRPDLAVLNSLAGEICGTHDFTTFASADDENADKVRTVSTSAFHVEQGGTIVYTISADSFLRRMVRSIVGTLLEVEAHGGAPAQVRAALETRDRRLVGPTAPARGLFLERVMYSGEPTGSR